MGAFYQQMTKNNYPLSHVASALQKAIRRGEEENAMFWVVELCLPNAKGSAYDEYAWKRLRIMCSEDIGLAWPSGPAVIQGLYQMYNDQKKKKDDKHAPERLYITHAVLLLCRAKKSRLVDWTLIYHWKSHHAIMRAIPDYAYDKHNSEGKRKGRGVDHFYSDGSMLNNYANVPGEEEMKGLARKAEDLKPGSADQADMFDESEEG
jgi:replication-associated recombination protein RarA